MGKITAFIVLALIAALIITTGLLLFQNRQLVQKLSPSQSIASVQQKGLPALATPGTNQNPKQSLSQIQEEISTNINTGNFQALENYIAGPTVEFVIKSSECCQPLAPRDAAAQTEYVSKGIPMDFAQNNAQIVSLKSKYLELQNTFLGISKSGEELIAFSFNNDNKIQKIIMAKSWKVFDFSQQQPSPN